MTEGRPSATEGRSPSNMTGSGPRSAGSELQITRCTACGNVSWPPRLLCPACGAPGFEPIAAGPGVIKQHTETQTPAGEPVALATVVLDAGPWVVARVTDATLGDRVTLLLTDTGGVEAIR